MKNLVVQLPNYSTWKGKWEFLYALLLPLGLFNLVVSIFLIDNHIAIHSITFSIVLALLVFRAIIKKEIPNGIPFPLLLVIFFGYVFFAIGTANSTGVNSDSVYLIRRWKIFPVYALIFFLLPTQKKELYYILLLIFISAVFLLNGYALYKYYDLIIVNQGQTLPDASWINFMDLMKPYILPFDFYHHTLSLFCALSLAFVWYLWCKLPTLKIFFLIVIPFFVFMIHFYGSRTGIVVFYLLLLFYLFNEFSKQKQAFLKITFTCLISSVFMVMSYFFVPTLKLKTDKLVEEITFYKNSNYDQILNGPDYRLPSYFKAFEIIKQHPIAGVGFKSINTYFKNTSKPLNNYIFLTLVLGIPIGVFLFFTHFCFVYYIQKLEGIDLILLSFFVLHFLYSFSDAALFYVDYFYFFAFWSVALVHVKYNLKSE